MGHLIGKDIYRKLGRKVDNLTMRAPWNEAFHAILRELYSPEEADLAIMMPYGLSTIDQIERATKYDRARLQKLLAGMCDRGLAMDLWLHGEYRYMLSPIIVGIFEFTMMRTGPNLDTKEWARLFHTYLQTGEFYAANLKHSERVSPLRTLPHEEAIAPAQFVEVLDYEKATAIVESANTFSIGLCSCRHEKLHVGEKKCDVPLETCCTFGTAAEYMVRHNLAREVDKSEMLDNLARAREIGLVFNADNVQQNVSFICVCCKCCCNVLLGISRFGYPNTVVTSNFVAQRDQDLCADCGTCAESCPIDAITAQPDGQPKIDTSICLGCGVCALRCNTGALKLVKRKQRVLHPETTFERVILQCLERGTLQNMLFSNPQSVTHTFMRGVLGGFLRLLPVKKALMSDTLRSSFLNAMKRGA